MLTHVAMLVIGLIAHKHDIPLIFHHAAIDGRHAIDALGLVPAIVLMLRAYAMGAGTYTGLEAVSNNVNILKEPRVRTQMDHVLHGDFFVSHGWWYLVYVYAMGCNTTRASYL